MREVEGHGYLPTGVQHRAALYLGREDSAIPSRGGERGAAASQPRGDACPAPDQAAMDGAGLAGRMARKSVALTSSRRRRMELAVRDEWGWWWLGKRSAHVGAVDSPSPAKVGAPNQTATLDVPATAMSQGMENHGGRRGP